MGNKLSKFDFDHWADVTPRELQPGDIFSFGDVTAVFKSLSRDDRDRTVLNSEPIDVGTINLCLGEKGSDWEFIARVMDYVGSGCESFPDGTALITEFENGNTYVYSPRLVVKDLNEFCRLHFQKYVDFYSANAAKIDGGIKVNMERFW